VELLALLGGERGEEGVLGVAEGLVGLGEAARAFRRIMHLVLVVSLIADVLIWVSGAYDDTAKVETVLPLMALHILTAAVCWAILPAGGRRSEQRP
jgi:hypothetical protein